MCPYGAGGGGVAERVNRTSERMYARTARCSSSDNRSFQPAMAVRGRPLAMILRRSWSDLAEVWAEIKLPGRGDKEMAWIPSPRPSGPWQPAQCRS